MTRAEIDSFIGNIAKDEDGVWRTARGGPVSYPEHGHATCYGVEDSSFWFQHRNRCIAAVVGRYPPDPALPFLDVGGGNGYVAAMIQSLGFRTILVEPGIRGIENAKSRGLPELIQASTDELAIAPGSIGAIGLFDVIEHIQDDHAALRRLHPCLAVDGKVYATVPAHRLLWTEVDRKAGHFKRYTRGELSRLFESCGFRLDVLSYYFWPLPPAMLIFRKLPELLGMKRARESTRRVGREHRASSGMIDRLLSWEERILRNGGQVPVGASCIVVASRPGRATHEAMAQIPAQRP